MCNESFFEQHFLTQFLALQKDRVMMVRLSLAKILHNHMRMSGVLAKNVHILRTIQLLQKDSAKEVKECVLAAASECDKMKEVEVDWRDDIVPSANTDPELDDEEEKENRQRAEVEVILRQTLTIDEIDEKSSAHSAIVGSQRQPALGTSSALCIRKTNADSTVLSSTHTAVQPKP